MDNLNEFFKMLAEKKGIAVIRNEGDSQSDAAITPKDCIEDTRKILIVCLEQTLGIDNVEILDSELWDYGYKVNIKISYEQDSEKFFSSLTLTFNTIY